MAVKAPMRERIEEKKDVWVSNRALTFDEYLVEYEGVKEHVELVKGVPTPRMAANNPHEMLCSWVHIVLGYFVQKRDLGVVLGSRSAVKVSKYDGRLPDILFVRKERIHIIEYLSLSEPPDLVIELTSPGDRPSETMELESDYRNIGVREIVFVDTRRRKVKTLRMGESDYVEEKLQSGVLQLESVPGFWLDLDWIFDEPRPLVPDALAKIEAGIDYHPTH